MDNEQDSLINEEISYYSTTSIFGSFGVGVKEMQSPKYIHISFTPLSSNQKISFSNTIMIPSITTESSMETKIHNEKSKISLQRDKTKLKTESSKDEINNISLEKQEIKIIIKNDINKNEDNSNEIDSSNQVENRINNNLETNPFFFGNINYTANINKFQDNNSEIEEKKLRKILNKNKTQRKHSCEIINKNKIKNKIKRMKSSDITKIKQEINQEKEERGKKHRKTMIKFKTSPKKTDVIHKEYKSDKNLIIRNYKLSPNHRTREKTIFNKPSFFKDKNIKTYKITLFNKNSPKKPKTKDNIKGIKYKGMSHKFLLMGLEYKEKEDKIENITNYNSFKKKYQKNIQI